MMPSVSLRAARPLVALVALAIAACTDRPNATQPVPKDANPLIVCGEGCGGGGGGGGSPPPPPPPPPISISSLSLPNNTLPIDGALRSYNATLTNSGGTLTGVVAQGYLVQGSARRAAGGTQVYCNAGYGVLPNGTCQISFSVNASNTTSGSGTFVPGIATFELDLTVGSFTTTRTVGVNLVPGSFNGGGLGSPALSLSGALRHVTVGLQNTGSQTISSLSYQATVIQGSAQRSTGAMSMACGTAGWGNLPPGWCSQTIYLSLSNTNSGSGTLVPGPATLQVSLLQGTTVLSTNSSAITVADVHFTSITTSPDPVRLGGGAQPFTVTVSNAGGTLPNATYLGGSVRQGTVLQQLSVNATINCGAGPNVLPAGTCAISGTYHADTIQFGPHLAQGPATLYFTLLGDGGVSMLDSANVAIGLVGLPTIGTVTPASAATIGAPGPIVNYTGTINNPGPSVANATVTVRIIQGASNREANSGPASVECGAGPGTLPSGACTFTSSFFATNTGVGAGTLVPGAATLQVQLSDPANGLVSTKLVPITLVTP